MGLRWILASSVVLALAPAKPEAVSVRWAEGTLHGFLELRTKSGTLLAHGDLLQVPRDSDIESRFVFNFIDSSDFRETVTFSQHEVFRLESYHLIQHGKAFAADIEVTLSGNGDYAVKSTSHKDGKQQQYAGRLDLPSDTYNGMIMIIGKNVDRKAGRTVHIVAFTPKPIILPLALIPSPAEPITLGQRRENTLRFTVKAKLNFLQRIGAALKKQTPPDSYLWIVTDDVPAFLRFEGPLYSGPVWRVELASPGSAQLSKGPD
jgi:hypothetical protein